MKLVLYGTVSAMEFRYGDQHANLLPNCLIRCSVNRTNSSKTSLGRFPVKAISIILLIANSEIANDMLVSYFWD